MSCPGKQVIKFVPVFLNFSAVCPMTSFPMGSKKKKKKLNLKISRFLCWFVLRVETMPFQVCTF